MFHPGGGGLDLEDARLSHEPGCIELDFELIEIVKPKRLIFESFGYDHEWNYFRLETNELAPSGVNENDEDWIPYESNHDSEWVAELAPGKYYPTYILDDRSYYEEEYPVTDSERAVTRTFRGTYVIFNKRSVYNLTNSTYDGRHNKMTTDEFREYIQNTVNYFKNLEEKENLSGNLFSSTRRQKERRNKK